MKKTTVFFLAFAMMVYTGFAQSAKSVISGAVKDSMGQKALAYVTVEVFKSNTQSTPVKSSYTNDKGQFMISALDTGHYVLIFSHTGFAGQQKELNLGQ